ncbi:MULTISPECIES: Dps family protein [Helicobacter]|uniref:DNA starvation/stationary phase protection protein n=1 Tax=Helicobacter ibis TaxID=2962633 RepID=A0ABT4VEX8_9HELI|nr:MULTISPECIES: DNA starvation/stationary phase protection protein [Helicobacter]MDA3967125.1 DNA starvation/stationary phase protection protein [Helicobacter sp. WB40]MDA3969253.1 DNA starvation/stationary phase protection protein [Helicobacter ibis]
MSKVVQTLKQIQADSAVFYIKLHNYHWNVVGMDFHPVHKALEEMYDDITDLMDDCAERILQLNEKPYVTLKDMLSASKIAEESATKFDSKTILKAILPDYEMFLKNLRELSDIAGEANDKATVALADEKIASLEKFLWMLKAQLA